jgi:hypothetical protein
LRIASAFSGPTKSTSLKRSVTTASIVGGGKEVRCLLVVIIANSNIIIVLIQTSFHTATDRQVV